MIPGERSDAPGASDRRTSAARARTGTRAGGVDDGSTVPGRETSQSAWRGLDQGSIMSAELLTSTLLWFGVGWLVDRLLGTMPWFMFAGALLGNWTGLYLLWLRGQRSEGAGAARPSGDGALRAPVTAAGEASTAHRRTTETPHDRPAGVRTTPPTTTPRPTTTGSRGDSPREGDSSQADTRQKEREDAADDDD